MTPYFPHQNPQATGSCLVSIDDSISILHFNKNWRDSTESSNEMTFHPWVETNFSRHVIFCGNL